MFNVFKENRELKREAMVLRRRIKQKNDLYWLTIPDVPLLRTCFLCDKVSFKKDKIKKFKEKWSDGYSAKYICVTCLSK